MKQNLSPVQIIGIVLGVLLLVGGSYYYLFTKKPSDAPPIPMKIVGSGDAQPMAKPAGTPAGPTGAMSGPSLPGGGGPSLPGGPAGAPGPSLPR